MKIDINKIKYEEYFDENFKWQNINFYQTKKDVFTEDFINIFKDKIYWLLLSENIKLSDTELNKFQRYINWQTYLFNNKNLSEKLLNKYFKYFDKACWNIISSKFNLSIKFIRKFQDKLNFTQLIQNKIINRKLRKKFLEQFGNKLTTNQYFQTIEFRKYHKILINYIFTKNDLSGKHIYELLKLNIKIPEDFILKNIKNIFPCFILDSKKYSTKFKNEFKNELNMENI